MKNYKAPWSTTLIVSTLLASVLCVGLSVALPYLPQHDSGSRLVAIVRWLPLAIVPLCALFAIRGYRVTETEVEVRRVFWSRRIRRSDLRSARFVPGAMSRSVRICGNGGFFSFSGFFRSETLGTFRAYATDLSRTVVLRTEKKTYVLSPDEPEAFVRQLGLPGE